MNHEFSSASCGLLVGVVSPECQREIKVTGYNFNFARAIINLYTKHWAVSAENFGVSFRGVKTLCDRIYGLF